MQPIPNPLLGAAEGTALKCLPVLTACVAINNGKA